MIFGESNSYCTVWERENSENYSTVRLSSSRKDKKTDEYVNSNWSFVRFVGDAYNKLKKVPNKGRITSLKFSLSNEKYKNKAGEDVFPKSPRLTIYDFEVADAVAGGQAGAKKPRSKPIASEPDAEDGDLPF